MSVLLDTNVVSALMRAADEPIVVGWFDRQRVDRLFVAAPSIFEIRYGIEIMPQGRNREILDTAFDEVQQLLPNRVLPLDAESADAAGVVRASLRSRGLTVDVPDTQLAGIAINRRFRLATRNTKHFEGVGLRLVNPWEA